MDGGPGAECGTGTSKEGNRETPLFILPLTAFLYIDLSLICNIFLVNEKLLLTFKADLVAKNSLSFCLRKSLFSTSE